MLIPKYWAQHKQRFELRETPNKPARQVTIKRYGWSDISQMEALSHAKSRVNEAHHRWLAGEDILRRERKEEYNEGNSIPIREEIIDKHDFPENELSNNSAAVTKLIVTRNSYGAQVANVDNIAIIDVDNEDLLRHIYPDDYNHHGFMPAFLINQSNPASKIKIWFFVVVFILIASVIAWLGLSWLWLLVVMFGATAYLWQQASVKDKARAQKYADDAASLLPYMTDLIKKRIANHPTESFRLYQTPAGFRIIATHDVVLPSDRLVAEWFAYFHADTNYVRLCQVQQCFRARLTAKPWRLSEVENNKLAKDIPAKDFWFGSDNTDVDNSIEQRQDELKARKQWVADYDKYAKNYRACHYVEGFSGKETVDRNTAATQAIDAFIEWHDKACQVEKNLEMA
ncbi:MULTISPECIES: hypothetical protein [unclassified Psychrobacter]|uniref:hypothetical protein n=1 Tax=unclassified Psychrobacter TaxID=196806 RepID=UPI000ED2B9E6|nr:MULTISPECIES: hypothetical protein [unclassified Psychrobacter]MBE8609701.1 hypothetical protein [Pseudomonas lundensis]HCI75600.1 hypothetical protein [Psychrobacter sp.]